MMNAEATSTEHHLGLSVRRETWTILGRRFDLTWPADMDGLLDDPETHRRFQRDEYMPYWAQPWPASVLLTERVLRGQAGNARAAIELGCGIGLVSIAAAMMGWSVTASDYDARAIEFARLNAERSGQTLAATRLLDYRQPLDRPAFDLVLGSDLLYERRCAEPIAKWIASALYPGGVALVSDPNRSAADAFPEHVMAAGLAITLEPAETQSPSGLLVRGRIWTVTKAST